MRWGVVVVDVEVKFGFKGEPMRPSQTAAIAAISSRLGVFVTVPLNATMNLMMLAARLAIDFQLSCQLLEELHPASTG